MSVYKSQRGKSALQYVETARKLYIHTITNCVKFPKRYTFYLSQPIAETAGKIDEHVRIAEAIRPTNEHEYSARRDELNAVLGLLNSLDDKLSLIYDIIRKQHDFSTTYKWAPNAMLEWGRMINEERALITGVKKADRKREKVEDLKKE